MTSRVAHRMVDVSTIAPCSRCMDVLKLAAGVWQAAEPGQPDHWACDRCAQRDDASGFAIVASFRRMATRPALGRRRAA